MKKIDYKKILEKLIDEYPHEITKIIKIIKDAREDENYHEYISIDFPEIIKSNVWNSKEMYKLLRFFGYNPFNEHITVYNYNNNSKNEVPAFNYIIENNLENAFVACLKAMLISDKFYNGDYISLEEAYRRVISKVFYNKENKKNMVRYLTLALGNAPEDLIKKLISTQFKGYHPCAIYNESIFDIIIESKNLNLIKKYLEYVDDINLYLGVAVATGDIKIVEFFLDNGSDINFLYHQRILGYLTPIKMAIRCNDYEMYKFLKSRGAHIDTKIEEPDFKEKVLEWEIKVEGLAYNSKEELKEDENLIAKLEFKRCSSPLEYAITLNPQQTEYLPEKMSNRAKIIEDIINSTSDKNKIDYTQLIIALMATGNIELLKKYSKYIVDNNIKVSIKNIIDTLFSLNDEIKDEIIDSFLDFIEHFDKKEKTILYLLQLYFKYISFNICIPKVIVTDFLKKILDRASVEDRKKVPLIVYCKDLKTVKKFEEYGCNVNQVDEDGRNILYKLLCNRAAYQELTDEEWELFEYLLKNVDLSHKDKSGKTVLYYCMDLFDTNKEYRYANPEKFGPKNNIEVATTKLIEKMKKKDVCHEDISAVLDNRVENYLDNRGGHIHAEYVYQHHKDLFDALLKKGFKFSDSFYSNLFGSVFPEEGLYNEKLFEKLNVQDTVKYIFEKLDRNTKVQKFDIREPFNKIISYLNRRDATFEEFAKMFIDFNNSLVKLTEFYNKNILKRYNVEKYLEYAEEKYKTTYKDFNKMLLKIITKVILKFPNEDIDTILSLAPNYDINYITDGMQTDYSYWTYYGQIYDCGVNEETDEYEEIQTADRFEMDSYRLYRGCDYFLLDGGLVQFAILTNNVDLLKKLVQGGANLKFFIDDEDHTWDYVSSHTILSYMESILGKREDSNLGSDEKAYYLNLIGESN